MNRRQVFQSFGSFGAGVAWFPGDSAGAVIGIEPGAFGAAFFIPTAIVPPLLVTHALVFRLLLRPAR
jgi:hypothetical protein